MIPILVAGIALTAGLAGLAWKLWDDQAAFAAATFGVLATGIQLGAVALMRPVRGAALPRVMARWGAGMGLRLLGIVILALVAALDGTHFPPLPVALGFVGVLLPLLAMEVKLIR